MVKRKFAADTAASSSTLPPDVKRNELPAALPQPILQSRGPCAPAMVKKKLSHKSLHLEKSWCSCWFSAFFAPRKSILV